MGRYFFDYQIAHELPSVNGTWVEIDPTDTYQLYCRYDTSDTDVTIVGGEASNDEMCLWFIWYFPRPPIAVSQPELNWCMGDTICEGGSSSCGYENYPF